MISSIRPYSKRTPPPHCLLIIVAGHVAQVEGAAGGFLHQAGLFVVVAERPGVEVHVDRATGVAPGDPGALRRFSLSTAGAGIFFSASPYQRLSQPSQICRSIAAQSRGWPKPLVLIVLGASSRPMQAPRSTPTQALRAEAESVCLARQAATKARSLAVGSGPGGPGRRPRRRRRRGKGRRGRSASCGRSPRRVARKASHGLALWSARGDLRLSAVAQPPGQSFSARSIAWAKPRANRCRWSDCPSWRSP